MSKVLRRPLFRGGPVDPRGTGITSGLDDGRVRKQTGGGFGQFGSTFKPNIGVTPTGATNAALQATANNPSLAFRFGKNIAGPALSFGSRLFPALGIAEIGAQQYKMMDMLNEARKRGELDYIGDYGESEIGLGDFAADQDYQKGFFGSQKIKEATEIEEENKKIEAEKQKQLEELNKENEPTVTKDDLAELKKEIAGYEELLGVPKARKQMGYDALLRFAGAEGQDLKEKLQSYFREESKAPDLAQSKKEAAALLAIKGKQAKDLYSTKSMAELKDYMMKQQFLKGGLQQQYGELLTKSGKPDKAQFKGLALQNKAQSISVEDLPKLQAEKADGIFYIEAPTKEGTKQVIVRMINGEIVEQIDR
jgi:hypothetical protein